MDSRDLQPYPSYLRVVWSDPSPNTSTPFPRIINNPARFAPINNNNNPLPHSDPYHNNNEINNDTPKPCDLASESFKRGRGRPRNQSTPDDDTFASLASTHVSASSSSGKKRGRGRPPIPRKKELGIIGSVEAPNVAAIEKQRKVDADADLALQQTIAATSAEEQTFQDPLKKTTKVHVPRLAKGGAIRTSQRHKLGKLPN